LGGEDLETIVHERDELLEERAGADNGESKNQNVFKGTLSGFVSKKTPQKAGRASRAKEPEMNSELPHPRPPPSGFHDFPRSTHNLTQTGVGSSVEPHPGMKRIQLILLVSLLRSDYSARQLEFS
jgi:hypothetical protein